MPISRDSKAADMPPAGCHSRASDQRRTFLRGRSKPPLQPRRLADAMELKMNLTNIGLWLILMAFIALIPCGCIMTRPRKKDAPESPVISPAANLIDE
jgi:hypothetical protein